MKNKVLSLFLVVVMTVPVFSPILAVSYDDLLSRLDTIKTDIAAMKAEYEGILTTYPDVIDSLSAENKQNALTLADNMMADDIKEKVNAIKEELGTLTVPGASDVLDAINDLEDDAKDLIDDNKDIVEEVKSGYQDMTVDEIKEVVNKVNEIKDSLGYTVDTEATYTKLINIIDDAHAIGLEINDKIDDILDESIDYVDEIVTIDMLKELFNNVKNKDRDAVIDTIKDSIKGTTNEANIKALLDELKTKVSELKNKLMEANDLDESALISFDDTKKQVISNKAKDIENDYIDFAKDVIDTFAEDYIHELALVTYDVEVDEMIDYANKSIDVILDYEDTIKELYNNPKEKIKNYNFPAEVKDVVNKAGILVALGFVDVSDYNGEYFYNKFKSDIKDIVDYVSDELLDYIDHIDVVLQKEITDEVNNNSAAVAQTNVKTINAKRFATVDSIKALRTRVENEILSKSTKLDDAKAAIKKVAPIVYKMYYTNMLDAIEKVMLLENEKDDKQFEFNAAHGYIVTDSFLYIDDLEDAVAIPDEHIDILSFGKLSKTNEFQVMTSSTMDITFTEEVFGNYTIAVLGDVYADGKINSQDYMSIKNQIMGTKVLAAINKIAADTYRDNKIDSRDYMKIKNYIMKDIKIGL